MMKGTCASGLGRCSRDVERRAVGRGDWRAYPNNDRRFKKEQLRSPYTVFRKGLRSNARGKCV